MYYPMGDDENKKETDNMSSEDKKMYGDYDGKMKAEHDVKTMAEAGEIQHDKERLKRMKHCAEMQYKYVKSAS